jgi:hypothetical protein
VTLRPSGPIPSPSRADLIEVLFDGPLTARQAGRVIALSMGRDDVWMNDYLIDFILWNETAFPMCGIEKALQQFHDSLEATMP